ncbi:MAG: MATE family efflux transporter [Sneathiella sp.]
MSEQTDILIANQPLSYHIRRTLHLAFPVILSRLGIIAMSAMDVIVLGRAGSTELSTYVLGQSVFDFLLVLMLGLLLGVSVLVARAIGANEDKQAGPIWYRGMVMALLYGSILFVILQFTEEYLLVTGQESDLAARAADVTAILAMSLPMIGLFTVSAGFLEAINRPFIGTIAILIANVSNLVLNIILVFGWDAAGIPAMGAIGCSISTVLNFALLSFGLVFFIRKIYGDRAKYGILEKGFSIWRGASEQRSIGYGAGASFGLEASAFSVLVLFAGLLGEATLAVYGILFQFIALFFMGALGVAVATQIRVGNAWGRNDHHGMKYAGWTGLALSLVFTGSAAILLLSVPESMLRIFTIDQKIINAALPALFWVALSLVFDGGQVVVNHACRGRGDVWVPTICHFGSYWLLMLPASAYFTFEMGYGVSGIFMGVVVSAIFSVAVLSLRFARLSR